MGIKSLNTLLKQYCKSAIQEKKLSMFINKKIGIDTSIFLYKYMYNNNDYLGGFIIHSLRLLQNGIIPLFVFDGKPPDEKCDVLKSRKNKKEFYYKKIELLKDILEAKNNDIIQNSEELYNSEVEKKLYNEFINKNISDIDNEIKKVSKKIICITKEDISNCKELFNLMGIPYVDANGEAETFCAKIAQNNLIDGCITEDTDFLANRGNILIKNFNKNSNNIITYELKEILRCLNLSYDEFLDLCILCGCDYTSKIYGIGPITGYKLIKENSTIENVLQKIKDNPKYKIPDNFDYKKARYLFKNEMKDLNISEINNILILKKPDIENLNEFINSKIPEKSEKYNNIINKKLNKYYLNIVNNKVKIVKTKKNQSIKNFFKEKKKNNDVIITENII